MSLVRFFKENTAERIVQKDIIISDRFKDENGNLIAFKIQSLEPKQFGKIQDSAYTIDVKSQKMNFNSDIYKRNLMASCVVYPDLMDSELQDNYGVTNPQDLLNEMLSAGEFNALYQEVEKINSTKSIEELKGEVKN